jgi:hypothetical protein
MEVLGRGHYVFLSVLRCRKQGVLVTAARAILLGVLLGEGLVFHRLQSLPLEVEAVFLHGSLDLQLIVVVCEFGEDSSAEVVALDKSTGTAFWEPPWVFWFSPVCLSKVRGTFLFASIIILTHTFSNRPNNNLNPTHHVTG